MSYWFKRNPELLERECRLLEANSNYKEHYRYRDSLLASTGEIIVRLEKTTKHPVLIVYPESTPFSLPKVYLLSQVLTEDELKKVCELSSIPITKIINDKQNYYNYWHQNADGSLCLLEQDNLEKYGEFFSINDVINRTRDWLAGNKTGNLPPDNPEVDLFYHFKNQDLSIEFLFPESFYKDEIIQGDFYSTLIAQAYLGMKKIYIGALLNGENNKGIYLPVEYNNKLQLMPEGIASSGDIINKPGVINNAIEKEQLIKGYWWQLSGMIEPFMNIDQFASVLGEGDSEKGYKRMHTVVKDGIKGLPGKVYFGIRFKNNKGENQWQVFALNKVRSDFSPIIGDNSVENFKPLFGNYEMKAFKCSVFSDDRQHLRNKGRTERNILKNKAVTLSGCGSLGGEVGDAISKAGIGKMSLVDVDFMKIDNSIRHVIGIGQIGLAKAHALYAYILHHNPFVEVSTFILDIMSNDLMSYFIDESIGISTIADDNVECYLNEQAVINNKTIFYSRSLRGAKAARIFRVIPGKDACFYCLNIYSDQGDERFVKIPPDENLPTITNECNNPIRPASAADLKIIAGITSRIILDYLQNGNEEFNHWIWNTEDLGNTPFTIHSSFLPPHPQCPYCKPESRIKVEINEEVLNFIVQETQMSADIETGGVLLGSIENDKAIIRFASGPGSNAIRKHTEFLKDKEFCQNFIDEHYAEHSLNAAYIGEWHYHPSFDNTPSGRDIQSFSNIANGKGYLTEHPVMIILNSNGSPSCTVHPINKSFYYTEIKTMKNNNT